MKKLTFFVTLSFLAIAYTSFGQPLGTKDPTSNVTVKIAEVLDLAVATGATVDFNFNSIELLDAGIQADNAVTLTYKSNKPWFINIAANSTEFSGGDPLAKMPASILTYRLNGTGTGTTGFSPLSTTAVSLKGTTGAKNTAIGSATIGVDYRMNPGYNYAPAQDYALSVTYTISNQ